VIGSFGIDRSDMSLPFQGFGHSRWALFRKTSFLGIDYDSNWRAPLGLSPSLEYLNVVAVDPADSRKILWGLACADTEGERRRVDRMPQPCSGLSMN